VGGVGGGGVLEKQCVCDTFPAAARPFRVQGRRGSLGDGEAGDLVGVGPGKWNRVWVGGAKVRVCRKPMNLCINVNCI